MCGRFVLTHPSDALARLFEAVPANDLPDVPNYNICPTEDVHAVIAGANGRRLRSLRWGFVPHWAKTLADGPLLINARAETIAEKPAFRDAVRTRRCLIPATGFYEWTKGADGTRLPWYIASASSRPLVFAGVWQEWSETRLCTCAIVTTRANAEMSRLHHRMPVILDPADWALWLGERGKGAAKLLEGARDRALEMHRVDPRVNSNRAEGPELIAPVG